MYLGLTTAQSAARRAATVKPVFASEQPMPADGVLTTGDIPADFANLQAGKTVYRRMAKNAGTPSSPKYAAILAPDPAHRGRMRVVGRAPVMVSYLVDVYGAIYKFPYPAATLDEFNQRIAQANASDSDLFSRHNMLKVARIAAAVAAVYFAAPYIASAVTSGGAAAGASAAEAGAAGSAAAGAGTAAEAAAAGSSLFPSLTTITGAIPGAGAFLETSAGAALTQQLKQKAEEKLFSLAMPKRPAPGVITAPQPLSVSQPPQVQAPAPSAAKPLLLTIAGALPFLLLL